MANDRIACVVLLTACLLTGCREPVHFPDRNMPEAAAAVGAFSAWDTTGDGLANFFAFTEDNGRIRRVGYDQTGDQRPDVIVDLDEMPVVDCRHIFIILDGFAYDVVKQFYDDGGLRMFHPPARLIAPYPTLTDPSIEDLLGYIPCQGFESLYYSRKQHKLVGGTWAYIKQTNQPYGRLLQYRAKMFWDGIGYVLPKPAFRKEVHEVKQVIDKAATKEALCYLVTSAGVSTKYGAQGQRWSLQKIEQLVNQVIYETRGLVKVTLVADHGHTYTPSERLPIERFLKEKGWRMTQSLDKPDDVVYLAFGLETYASFVTNRPAKLAENLMELQGVELASYIDGHHVELLGADGSRAQIYRKDRRYRYVPLRGDPLSLAPILAELPKDRDGYYDADDLFRATAEHIWPAPLQRLWRAHFSLVENPPDVIASLADDVHSGKNAFGISVDVASTHGSLNRINSTTFIMSTIGPVQGPLRNRDVPSLMERLLNVPHWPMRW